MVTQGSTTLENSIAKGTGMKGMSLPLFDEALIALQEESEEERKWNYELATIDFKGLNVKPYEDLSLNTQVALELLMWWATNGELEGHIIPDELALRYWNYFAIAVGLPVGMTALEKAAWQLRGN